MHATVSKVVTVCSLTVAMIAVELIAPVQVLQLEVQVLVPVMEVILS
jgi:hypothetical protein